MSTDNHGIDHGTILDNLEEPDRSTDPEGAERREEKPPVNNPYVNDMMAFNDKRGRWEPAEHFILSKARDVRNLHKAACERQKPLTKKDREQAMGFLNQAADQMESGPYNGLLYGLKDLILKQMCSTYIWMENSEAMKSSMLVQGQDPAGENVKRSEDAIEKNRVAFFYYSNLLRALSEEHDDTISLSDFAWINGARQASWDFLGYYKRMATDPSKQKSPATKRRTGEELLFS